MARKQMLRSGRPLLAIALQTMGEASRFKSRIDKHDLKRAELLACSLLGPTRRLILFQNGTACVK